MRFALNSLLDFRPYTYIYINKLLCIHIKLFRRDDGSLIKLPAGDFPKQIHPTWTIQQDEEDACKGEIVKILSAYQS